MIVFMMTEMNLVYKTSGEVVSYFFPRQLYSEMRSIC